MEEREASKRQAVEEVREGGREGGREGCDIFKAWLFVPLQ